MTPLMSSSYFVTLTTKKFPNTLKLVALLVLVVAIAHKEGLHIQGIVPIHLLL